MGVGGVSVDIQRYLRIRVTHQVLQILDVHSGVRHIGAEGMPQHMGRDGGQRIVGMKLPFPGCTPSW